MKKRRGLNDKLTGVFQEHSWKSRRHRDVDAVFQDVGSACLLVCEVKAKGYFLAFVRVGGLLSAVSGLFLFCILFQSRYGARFIPPSTDRTSTVFLHQLL